MPEVVIKLFFFEIKTDVDANFLSDLIVKIVSTICILGIPLFFLTRNQFKLKIREGENYAACAGTYKKFGRALNNRPVYYCQDRDRFIGWDGNHWTCTSYSAYYNAIIAEQGGFGGFYSSIDSEESIFNSTWKNFTIERTYW